MKSKLDRFERSVRSKLFRLDPDWPRDRFAAVQQRLAARRKRLRTLRLIALALLLLAGTSLWWMYFATPKSTILRPENHHVLDERPPLAIRSSDGASERFESGSRLNREMQVEPSAVFRGAPRNSQASEALSSSPGTMNPDEIPPLPSRKTFAAPLKRESTIETPKATESLQMILPLFKIPSTRLELLPGREENALSGYTAFSPALSARRKLAWEGMVTGGLSYYHLIPDRRDAVHFYALENPQQDFSLTASIAARRQVSSRFSMGLQAQYAYTQTTVVLKSIEESPGNSARVQLRDNQHSLFFPDYAERRDILNGDFHQLGLGAVFRYQLSAVGSTGIDTQLGSTFLQLLQGDNTGFFPRRTWKLDLSAGISRPLSEHLAWTIRPTLSYGVAVGRRPEALQVNRMSFGLGISLGSRSQW